MVETEIADVRKEKIMVKWRKPGAILILTTFLITNVSGVLRAQAAEIIDETVIEMESADETTAESESIVPEILEEERFEDITLGTSEEMAADAEKEDEKKDQAVEENVEKTEEAAAETVEETEITEETGTIGRALKAKETTAMPAQGVSAYAIIGPSPANHTFRFYVGDELYKTVILKEGETLAQPASPIKEGKIFAGWYADAGLTAEFTDFGQTADMDDGTTNIYAKFDSQMVYVFYHDVDGSILWTEIVEAGSEITVTAEFPHISVEDVTKKNIGWSVKKGESDSIVGTYTVGTSDIDFYPVVEAGKWISFDCKGGSHIAPIFINGDEVLTRPEDPVHIGYEFAGWYTDSACSEGNEFDFDENSITESITIYAKWEAAEVAYTIIYWTENANDDAYSIYSIAEGKGYAGEQTTIVGLASVPSGFHINGSAASDRAEDPRNETVEIAGDGSTVQNIYYSRNEYTYVYTINKQQEIARFERVRYGENIYKHYTDNAALKEAVDFAKENSYLWRRRSDQYAWSPFLPERKATYAPGSVKSDGYVEYIDRQANPSKLFESVRIYCFEALKDADIPVGPEGAEILEEEIAREGVSYDTFIKITGIAAYHDALGVQHDQYAGFTIIAVEGEKTTIDTNKYGFDWFWLCTIRDDGVTSYPVYLYARRNQYTLQFNTLDGKPNTKIEDVYYQQNLSAYAPTEYKEGQYTETIDGVECAFGGWYTDASCEEVTKFDFETQTMPAYDLVLFAKWNPVQHTVTFDANGGALACEETVKVNANDTLTEPSDPLREGYVFAGWTRDGQPYYFDTVVTENFTLTANWYNAAVFTVSYDDGTKDSGSYHEDTYVQLKDGTRNNFVGWKDKKGNLYRSGQRFRICPDLADEKNNILLKAVYAEDSGTTQLIYDLNYSYYNIDAQMAVEEVKFTNIDNNSKVMLKDITDSELGKNTVPDGYIFEGWYLTETCTGDAVTQVLVDKENQEENKVYAKWVPCTPAVCELSVRKAVTGDEPDEKDTYTFLLSAEPSKSVLPPGMTAMPMPENSMDQSVTRSIRGIGECRYGEITFTRSGTYVYSVVEVDLRQDGYIYDRAVYLVSYTVWQEGDRLLAECTLTKDGIAAEEISFTNVYRQGENDNLKETEDVENTEPSGILPYGNDRESISVQSQTAEAVQSSQTTESDGNGNRAAGPATGDRDNTILFLLMIFISIACIAGIGQYYDRRRHQGRS